MTEEEKQKLNEKLAEWAGFEFSAESGFGKCWVMDGRHYSLPQFTDSFGACQEWLVPNLEFVRVEWSCQPRVSKGGWARAFIRTMSNIPIEGTVGGLTFEASESTQELAICRAVEKLIASRGKLTFLSECDDDKAKN